MQKISSRNDQRSSMMKYHQKPSSLASRPLLLLLGLLIVLLVVLASLRDPPSPFTVDLPAVRVTVGGNYTYCA